jgi:hypothetical protein
MADQAGGLSSAFADASKVNLYGDDTGSRLQQINDAQQQALDALQQRYENPNWFSIAAGFLKPQLGGFSASLGSASQAASDWVEQSRANQLPIAQLKLQMAQTNALLQNKQKAADIATNIANQNRRPTPKELQVIANLDPERGAQMMKGEELSNQTFANNMAVTLANWKATGQSPQLINEQGLPATQGFPNPGGGSGGQTIPIAGYRVAAPAPASAPPAAAPTAPTAAPTAAPANIPSNARTLDSSSDAGKQFGALSDQLTSLDGKTDPASIKQIADIKSQMSDLFNKNSVPVSQPESGQQPHQRTMIGSPDNISVNNPQSEIQLSFAENNKKNEDAAQAYKDHLIKVSNPTAQSNLMNNFQILGDLSNDPRFSSSLAVLSGKGLLSSLANLVQDGLHLDAAGFNARVSANLAGAKIASLPEPDLSYVQELYRQIAILKYNDSKYELGGVSMNVDNTTTPSALKFAVRTGLIHTMAEVNRFEDMNKLLSNQHEDYVLNPNSATRTYDAQNSPSQAKILKDEQEAIAKATATFLGHGNKEKK